MPRDDLVMYAQHSRSPWPAIPGPRNIAMYWGNRPEKDMEQWLDFFLVVSLEAGLRLGQRFSRPKQSCYFPTGLHHLRQFAVEFLKEIIMKIEQAVILTK
jgi:hypothetical protein